MPTSNRSKKSKETNNELQNIQSKTDSAMTSIYPPIINDISNKLKWEDVAKEVKDIFNDNDYRGKVKGVTLSGSVAGTEVGLGSVLAVSSVEDLSDYYLQTSYKGTTLSKRLRLDANEAERIISNVVKQQLEFKTNWEILATEIGKRTNTVGDVAGYINDLNEQGTKFIKGKLSLEEQKAFKKLVKNAQFQVDRLSPGNAPTKQLKKAYQGVIDAVNSKDQKLLNAAVTNAFNAKIDYNNQRLSRSELSRAYGLSFQRQIEEDDVVIGYRFLLSSAHPRPDQCDCMAEVDNGGGRGVYKKGDAPSVPVHTFCLCMLEAWVDRGQALPGRYTQKNAIEYLDSIDDKKRGQIIGVGNAKYKSSYSKGLKSKDIHPESFPKRTMLPKSLITEGVPNDN